MTVVQHGGVGAACTYACVTGVSAPATGVNFESDGQITMRILTACSLSSQLLYSICARNGAGLTHKNLASSWYS